MTIAKLMAAYAAARKAWEASYGIAEYYWRWRCRRAAKRLRRARQAGEVETGHGNGGTDREGI